MTIGYSDLTGSTDSFFQSGVRFAAAVAALALASSAAAAQPAAAPDFSWLRGDWISCTTERVSEERWLEAGANGLAGVAVTRPRQGAASFEFARVAPHQGGWAYMASPGGVAPTIFAMTESTASSAVFENAANDFPKRIAYRRTGDVLGATISNPGGPSMSWTFAPATSNPACPAG